MSTDVFTGMRSAQVARAAGVNLQTLRYSERRGLLAEPDRSPGGHRLYPPEAVTVVRVIKAAALWQRSLRRLQELAAGVIEFATVESPRRKRRRSDSASICQSAHSAQRSGSASASTRWLISSRPDSTGTVVPMPACKLMQPPRLPRSMPVSMIFASSAPA